MAPGDLVTDERRLAQAGLAAQAALRRVATLVAQQATPAQVVAAVAEEIQLALGLPLVVIARYEPDNTILVLGSTGEGHRFRPGIRLPLSPGVSLLVRHTGRPARVEYDDLPGAIAETAREDGFKGALGVPIVVDGEIWGAVAAVSTQEQPLPDDTEERLSEFTELVATAISNAEAHDALRRLADEQAALRRVAVLVAAGAEPNEVFAAVAEEVANLLEVPAISMVRFEPDETSTAIAVWGDANPFGVGATFEPWPGVMLTVRQTGRPSRLEDFASLTGPTTARLLAARIHSGVGVPIIVEGSAWGTIIALATGGESLPAGIEVRLSSFTELVATAIANTQARDDVRRLADEQAALRRVATLVAHGVEPHAVFDIVCQETGPLFGATSTNLCYFTPDGFNLTMSGWSLRDTHVPTGTRLPLEGDTINVLVKRTGAPGRFDTYEDAAGQLAALLRARGIRSEVGAPVIVGGKTWGALIAGWDTDDPPPAGIENRVAGFAELIATAIANTQALDDLQRLAAEQAALRRVATLIAREVTPTEVFAAVAEEVALTLDVPLTAVVRYDTGDRATQVGAWGPENPFPVGTNWTLDSRSVSGMVARTGKPARVDDYAEIPGEIAAALARTAGIRTAVGSPVLIDGRPWGVIMALSTEQRPLPIGTEERLTGFTDLIATAIGNAQARDELSRNEALYRRAITQAGAVPYALDYGTGRYTFIGEGIEELTGYRPDELTHERFGSLVLETYLHGEQSGLDSTDAARRTQAGEFERWHTDLRIKRRDGELRWVGDASVEILGEDGRSVGSIGLLQDITERMAKEEERVRLAAILEATTDVVVLTDHGGHMLYMNRAARNLLGIDPQQDISALKQSEFQPDASASRVEEGIATAIREGSWSGESMLVTRHGREIPVSQVILAHKDANGEVAFLSAMSRDMTQQRELEERLRRAQEEQTSLRRVATLVAQGAPSAEVFAAVAEEVARVTRVPLVEIARFEPDGTMAVVGHAGDHPFRTGTKWPLDNPEGSAAILDMGRAIKVEYTDELPGAIAEAARNAGMRWALGVPIVVDGKVWGSIGVARSDGGDVPAGAESRLAGFTQLVATAISNTTNYAQLLASRARIVAATDETRRRIERNLHDGTQQQLVALGLDLQALKATVPPELSEQTTEIERIQSGLAAVVDDVREISRGVHPALLSHSGLAAALRALVRRSALPVELDIEADARFVQSIEIAAYYVASEALANAAKHSQASIVHLRLAASTDCLRMSIADDGIGGATIQPGAGLAGLVDRVEALGGQLKLDSTSGEGTTITVALPLFEPAATA